MNIVENDAPYFLGIDIGSHSFKAAIGYVKVWDTFDFEILAAVEESSDNAIERGSAVNMDKTGLIIKNVMDALSQQAGLSQDIDLYGAFSIHDKSVVSRVNKAKYPFSKSPREVRSDDLEKAREMASNFPLQSGQDYIHIMTRNYRIDNRLPKRKPEGELGLSLEAEVFLVSAQQQEIIKYKQCADRASIPLNYICAGPIAAAEGVLTRIQKEQPTILIDIGSQTTSAVLFEADIPKILSIVPLGSGDITRDISRVLHIPQPLAENLKKRYTCVDEMYFPEFPESVTKHEEDYDQSFTIKPSDLYKISYARMYEIFKLLYNSMQISELAHAYPIVLTGGGSRLMGCKQMLEKITSSKVDMGQPWNWGGPFSEYRTPSFSTSIGLCAVAARHYASCIGAEEYSLHGTESNKSYKSSAIKTMFKNIGSNMKRFFSFGEIEH